jgi:Peptidase C39 family
MEIQVRPRWANCRLAIIAGLLGIGWAIPLYAQDKPDAEPTDNDCGLLALYNLFCLEGRPRDLSEIKAHLPVPAPDGYSMMELRDAARACGVNLTGFKLKTSDRAPDRPMLLFLKGIRHGHYVAVRPVGHTGKLVQVLDFNLDPIVVDAGKLCALPEWTGFALVPDRPNWAARIGWTLLAGAVVWGLASLVKPRLHRFACRLLTAKPAEGTQDTSYSNYKEFDGLKKATKVESKRDGEKFVDIVVSDFKVLDKVDPETFSQPK